MAKEYTNNATEKQRVKELTDRLEQGLDELFNSENYKKYLTTMSKFHNYSFNNTMLIAMQKPEASLVAGYQAWQKDFERHVKRGEKEIRILAPAPYKIKEEQDKLDPVTGELMLDQNGQPQKEEVEITIPAFRAVSVFDVSQTEGKPSPELAAKELLSTVEGYEDFLQAIRNIAPVPVEFEEIAGGSKGYYDTLEKRIAVQKNMSESQTLKTLVHETAHSILHDKEVNQDTNMPIKDRNTKEVEAESVAYTVCQHFGIDTSEYSFGYIAGWSSGRDKRELHSSMDTIRKTASEMITGIEGHLLALEQERAVQQEAERESILLIHNTDLSEYTLLNVRGMDKEELLTALGEMTENDKLSVEAYLEIRGAWTTELSNEHTEEVEEYHLDVRYNMDTDEITEIEKQPEPTKEALSPMQQAERIINEIEENRTIFSNDERNLIVNYAYKLADMDKTRELAGKLAFMEENSPNNVALAIIDAQAEIDALPDSMIGLSEMYDYGYTWEEMLPLTKERATELYEQGVSVCLLYPDGTETEADSISQIDGYNGIFGVEKKDWKIYQSRETEEELSEISDLVDHQQTQLLYGSTDSYGIYQLKDDPELVNLRFMGTESLKQMGITKDNVNAIKPDNYELIYSGELKGLQRDTQNEKLEAIFEKFNIDHPADYRGHSLSVSDIVVLHEDGENTAHFVDSFGFTGLPQFMRELEGEREPEQVQEAGKDTSGHNIQKQDTEKEQEISVSDGDEIIDLGEEREQVMAELKQSIEQEQPETELAFQIADRYIIIQESTDGYEYTIAGADFKEIDGGVYDDPDMSIREALAEIVEDIRTENSILKENVTAESELQPLDYDEISEKIKEANQVIVPSTIVAAFRAKMEELFHNISELNATEIEETVRRHVQAKLDEAGIVANIVDVVLSGSRARGLEQDSSDIDVVVQIDTAEREDDLFSILNEDSLYIGEVKVDINPITEAKTGTLETYLPQVEQYLEQKAIEREQQQTQVSFTVAECGEFHTMGEYHENISTIEEAVKVWEQIPPERMHGIPAIGINIHTPGDEPYQDIEMDILSGKKIYLNLLQRVPKITENEQARDAIRELIQRIPDVEVIGSKEWIEHGTDEVFKLAADIDQFSYNLDTYGYRDQVEDRDAQVLSIEDDIRNGNTEYLTDFLNAAIVDNVSESVVETVGEGKSLEESQSVQLIREAKLLLERLAAYQPLAKIEELEEANYNMIDNVLNNGAEKKEQKAENRRERASLKERLAEKKAEIAKQSQEPQRTEKKQDREK